MKEDFYYWPTDLLVNYVAEVQHKQMDEMLTDIAADMEMLVLEHGQRSPQLYELQTVFTSLAFELQIHLSKEAMTIFPFVSRYGKELKKQKSQRKTGLNSVCFPIHKMYKEHKKEKRYFKLLLNMMDLGGFPETDDALYNAIKEKTHQLYTLWEEQVRLENDILFPKIVEMEACLDPI